MKVTKSYLKQVILEELQQEVASMDEAQVDESQLDEGTVGNISMAALIALSTAIAGSKIPGLMQRTKQINQIINTGNVKKVDEKVAMELFQKLTGGDPVKNRMLLQAGALDIFLAGQVLDGKITIDQNGKVKTTEAGSVGNSPQAPVK